VDVPQALSILVEDYAGRGIELVERGNRWHFQTAPDLAHILRREKDEARKLSRARSRRSPSSPITSRSAAPR
jgi:segregation and condensation protein B